MNWVVVDSSKPYIPQYYTSPQSELPASFHQASPAFTMDPYVSQEVLGELSYPGDKVFFDLQDQER